MPNEKFVKKSLSISNSEKVLLIRHANVLLNNNKMYEALKIFSSLDHGAGCLRVAKKLYDNNDYIEALKIYKNYDIELYQSMIEKITLSIKNLINN